MMPNPFVWFFVGVVELLILVPLMLFWVPDSWSDGAKVALGILAVAAVSIGNLVVVRQLRRRDQRDRTTAR